MKFVIVALLLVLSGRAQAGELPDPTDIPATDFQDTGRRNGLAVPTTALIRQEGEPALVLHGFMVPQGLRAVFVWARTEGPALECRGFVARETIGQGGAARITCRSPNRPDLHLDIPTPASLWGRPWGHFVARGRPHAAGAGVVDLALSWSLAGFPAPPDVGF